LQVALQGIDGVTPNQDRHDHAYDVPDITAVVRKVRNQFDEKRKQREEYEAPDKGPISVLAMPCKQPSANHQQGQGNRQPDEEILHVDAALKRIEFFLGLGAKRRFRRPFLLQHLPVLCVGLLYLVQRFLCSTDVVIERFQRMRTADKLLVLISLFGRRAGGEPVRECFVRARIFGRRGLQSEPRGLLGCLAIAGIALLA
jgi:hypothetical protein